MKRWIKTRLAERRYRRAMANVRRWCAIPDDVSDDEVLAAVRVLGVGLRAVGVPAGQASASLQRASDAARAAGMSPADLRETVERTRGRTRTPRTPDR